MPANWLWILGGIFIGLFVFTIAYNLIIRTVYLSQKQQMLENFNTFYANIKLVCLQEIGNSISMEMNIPDFVRVVYATNNIEHAEPRVIDKIKNKELSKGKNLCIQFKTEQELRCVELPCNMTIPYIGSLPMHMDIKLMVKKILGEPQAKEYYLFIKKVSGDEVEVTLR